MILVLKRKADVNDKNSLIVMVENEKSLFTKRMAIGDTIEVDDQLGYTIMSKYPKCFEQFANGEKYKTKVMAAESK